MLLISFVFHLFILSLARLGTNLLDVFMVLGVTLEGWQVHTQELYVSNIMVCWTSFLDPDSILYAPMHYSKCFRLLALTMNVAVTSWTPVCPSVLSTITSIHNLKRNDPRPLSVTNGFMALSEEQDNTWGKPLGVLPVSEFLLLVALKSSISYRTKQCCLLEKPTK